MALLTAIQGWHDDPVFTRTFIEIGQPFEAVEDALLGPPEKWLPDPVPTFHPSGLRQLDVRIGAGGLTKKVHLSIGDPTREPTKTTLPVSWLASGPSSLFPELAGTLEISRFGPRQTLLALLVEYTPPIGGLGEILDEAVLHRLAWATLSSFSEDVAASLDALARRSRPHAAGASSR